MKWHTVCFDIDNTLFDYELAFQKCMTSVIQLFIKDIHLTEWFRYFKKYCDELWENYENGTWSQAEYRYKRLYHSLIPFNYTISKEFAELFHSLFERRVHLYVLPFPDVYETLTTLQLNGIQLAIISNGKNVTQMNKLKSLGLLSLFENRIFISSDIHYKKPNPKIFHFVKSKLACKDKPLYVGDSYEQDVLGAIGAGWDAIHFKKGQQKKEHIITCSNFKELLTIIL